MIGYLKGEVLESADGKLVVLAPGPAGGGVGYAVSVPLSAAYAFVAAGEPVELFVHTHVREDALDLYGFLHRAEKDLFLTLLGVSGIGPKGALGILSKVEPAALVQAIVEGDAASLTKIPGIGKKTAERIVVELGDSMRKKMEAGTAPRVARAGAIAGALAATARTPITDAREALLGLGYREVEVDSLIERAVSACGAAEPRAEDLIRTALRQL